MTLGDAISQAQQTFPELSSTRAIQFADMIHQRVCRFLDIGTHLEEINLTSGTAAYDLPLTIGRIHAVIYRLSDTQWTILKPSSWEYEDRFNEDWRVTSTTGEPARYLVTTAQGSDPTDKLQVTLVPTPDTTTASGYPKLQIWMSGETTLDNASDVLPGSLLDAGCYVNGIRMLYAEAQALPVYGHFYEAYNRDLARCRARMDEMTVNDPARFTFQHLTMKPIV